MTKIISHNNFTEKELYKENICKECHEKRKEFAIFEKKYPKINPTYSRFFGSFSKNDTIQIPIDVLIILEGNSGTEDWSNISGNTENEFTKKYYVEKKYKNKSYHLNEMQKLLATLNEMNIRWVLTDFIKCYVQKSLSEKDKKVFLKEKGRPILFDVNKDNHEIAAKNCSYYMTAQIKNFEPKLILLFGGHAKNYFNKYVKNEIKENIIEAPFPSQSSANKWVQNGGVEEVVKRIKEQLL